MARKPPPSLPDVFARPGTAPSRGTAIEDLPQAAEAPPPAPPPPPTVVDAPPPAAELPFVPAPMRQPPPQGRRGLALAVAALAVALSAPYWEDDVLSLVGIRTPARRAAETSMLAALRQERRTEDIAQRLTAALAQITRQQAEFTTAMLRSDASAALIRTMALVRLSDTLRRPMPFAAELAVVRASGTDLDDLKPLLDQIEPYADTGIPGATQLRQEFRALFGQAADSADGGASWLTSLATWVRLRRPPPSGDPSLEMLRTASARLAEVDMAGAVEQTQQVSAAFQPMFANWIEDARARVAADRLAERVSELVTRTLRQSGSR